MGNFDCSEVSQWHTADGTNSPTNINCIMNCAKFLSLQYMACIQNNVSSNILKVFKDLSEILWGVTILF